MSYSKPVIFIDTNALSHLSNLELNKTRVSNWLWKHFDVKTCTSVKNEFNKNIQKANSYQKVLSKKLNSNGLIPRSRHLTKIENNWLGSKYYKKAMGSADAGERHLICVALEYLILKQSSQLIIVTDDNTARKYFLDHINNDIPFGSIWSTPDLILYMYLAFNNVHFEFGVNSLIDITSQDSFGFKRFIENGDSESDARIKMRKHYIDRLSKIQLLKNNAS